MANERRRVVYEFGSDAKELAAGLKEAATAAERLLSARLQLKAASSAANDPLSPKNTSKQASQARITTAEREADRRRKASQSLAEAARKHKGELGKLTEAQRKEVFQVLRRTPAENKLLNTISKVSRASDTGTTAVKKQTTATKAATRATLSYEDALRKLAERNRGLNDIRESRKGKDTKRATAFAKEAGDVVGFGATNPTTAKQRNAEINKAIKDRERSLDAQIALERKGTKTAKQIFAEREALFSEQRASDARHRVRESVARGGLSNAFSGLNAETFRSAIRQIESGQRTPKSFGLTGTAAQLRKQLSAFDADQIRQRVGDSGFASFSTRASEITRQADANRAIGASVGRVRESVARGGLSNAFSGLNAETFRLAVEQVESGQMRAGAFGGAATVKGMREQVKQAKDLSGALGELPGVLSKARAGFKSLDAQMSSAFGGALRRIRDVTTALILFNTLRQIREGVRATFDFLVDANAQLETARLGIVATTTISGQFVDRAGQALPIAQQVALAMQEADAILPKLLKVSADKGLPFEALRDAQVATAGFLKQANFTPDESVAAISNIVTVAEKLGISQSRVIKTVDNIIKGYRIAQTELGTALGFSDKMVASWREQGVFAAELNKRLEGVAKALKKNLETAQGLRTAIKSNLTILATQAGGGFFESYKSALDRLRRELMDVQRSPERMEGVARFFDRIGDKLESMTDKLIDFAKRTERFGLVGAIQEQAADAITGISAEGVRSLFIGALTFAAGKGFVVAAFATLFAEALARGTAQTLDRATGGQLGRVQGFFERMQEETVFGRFSVPARYSPIAFLGIESQATKDRNALEAEFERARSSAEKLFAARLRSITSIIETGKDEFFVLPQTQREALFDPRTGKVTSNILDLKPLKAPGSGFDFKAFDAEEGNGNAAANRLASLIEAANERLAGARLRAAQESLRSAEEVFQLTEREEDLNAKIDAIRLAGLAEREQIEAQIQRRFRPDLFPEIAKQANAILAEDLARSVAEEERRVQSARRAFPDIQFQKDIDKVSADAQMSRRNLEVQKEFEQSQLALLEARGVKGIAFLEIQAQINQRAFDGLDIALEELRQRQALLRTREAELVSSGRLAEADKVRIEINDIAKEIELSETHRATIINEQTAGILRQRDAMRENANALGSMLSQLRDGVKFDDILAQAGKSASDKFIKNFLEKKLNVLDPAMEDNFLGFIPKVLGEGGEQGGINFAKGFGDALGGFFGSGSNAPPPGLTGPPAPGGGGIGAGIGQGIGAAVSGAQAGAGFGQTLGLFGASQSQVNAATKRGAAGGVAGAGVGAAIGTFFGAPLVGAQIGAQLGGFIGAVTGLFKRSPLKFTNTRKAIQKAVKEAGLISPGKRDIRGQFEPGTFAATDVEAGVAAAFLDMTAEGRRGNTKGRKTLNRSDVIENFGFQVGGALTGRSAEDVRRRAFDVVSEIAGDFDSAVERLAVRRSEDLSKREKQLNQERQRNQALSIRGITVTPRPSLDILSEAEINADFLRDMGDLLRISDGVPRAFDAGRLAITAFAEDGTISIERMKRSVEDLSATIGTAIPDAIGKIAGGGGPRDVFTSIMDARRATLIDRAGERALDTPGITDPRLAEAAIKESEGFAALERGDTQLARRLFLEAESLARQGAAATARNLGPASSTFRIFGGAGGASSLSAMGPSGINSFDTPTLARVPGPIGRALPALVHGGETVRAPAQEDKVLAATTQTVMLLEALLNAVQKGTTIVMPNQPPIEVRISAEQVTAAMRAASARSATGVRTGASRNAGVRSN